MADRVNSKLNSLLASYKKWIVTNPQVLSEIEAAVRCLSYLGVGQFGKSSLTVELIYSMPNLIVLCNDLLMYRSKCEHLKIPQFESKIKIWLTVVEYVETLLEVSGKKLGGTKGKWLIVVVIQLFKTVSRLLLLYVYKERLTKSPATPPLNREKFNNVIDGAQLQEGFKLKRSGTVVRSIKHSVPIEMRTWRALPCNMDENENLTKSQKSEMSLKLAETIYIVKPLLHLGCMYVTNQKPWPPWILSLIVDLVSLNTFTRCAEKALFTKEEKEELVRRRLGLLLYLLRSPFYDKYSRTKIYAMLDAISNSVPLAHLLANAIKKNLPYMQNMYFYMWSPTGLIATGQTCTCFLGLTCPSGYTGGIDTRIVNNGLGCPAGYVLCCRSGGGGGSGGGLNDASCGIRKIPSTPQPQGRAPYGAYPWQVAILNANTNEYIGGGALISTTHVLTAAHKVATLSASAIKVRLGEWDSAATTEPYPYKEFLIQRITTHPGYNSGNLVNDIAVLKLNGVVETADSPNINTVCLTSTPPTPGRRCWVAGWGKNAFGNSGSYQSILKEVEVPVLTQEGCQTALRRTRLGSNFVLDGSFLCAGGEPGKDACTGDGGSPLVCLGANGRFEAIGLVTWGIGCADSGVPGVYTNVYNYLSWIRQVAT
ncbi:uncharacterized protein LOC105286577 [Ooceraea biroi]|uniref:uncharacterized protein LOC105286577 n=1 Tax=Ooceraea biroi TaxID=2015173 RepID=UPI000F096C67|nr:uncharacterized protein LOC105286577 [Ooceraea biroi]